MGGKMKCPVCEEVLRESKAPGLAEPSMERWECPSPNCGTIVTRPVPPPLAASDEDSQAPRWEL